MSLFEVNKDYDFIMLEAGDEGPDQVSFRARVISIDGPLIRTEQGGYEQIINTQSPYFVSAKRR